MNAYESTQGEKPIVLPAKDEKVLSPGKLLALIFGLLPVSSNCRCGDISCLGVVAGHWLFASKEGLYFSSLPDDGGTLKWHFEWNVWFSGKCKRGIGTRRLGGASVRSGQARVILFGALPQDTG